MADTITSEAQKFNSVEYLERMLEGAIAANDGDSCRNLRARLREITAAHQVGQEATTPAAAAAPAVAPAQSEVEPADEAEEPGTGGSSSPASPALGQVIGEVKPKAGPIGKAPFELSDILSYADAFKLREEKSITTVPQLLNFMKTRKSPLEALTTVKGIGGTRAQRIIIALLEASVDIEIEERD